MDWVRKIHGKYVGKPNCTIEGKYEVIGHNVMFYCYDMMISDKLRGKMLG